MKTSVLISVGTAICGGSAIAAVASVIGAAEQEISIAIGTIFLLNAIALYIFPMLEHLLHLTPDQFGTWAGIAIHFWGNSIRHGNGGQTISRTLDCANI